MASKIDFIKFYELVMYLHNINDYFQRTTFHIIESLFSSSSTHLSTVQYVQNNNFFEMWFGQCNFMVGSIKKSGERDSDIWCNCSKTDIYQLIPVRFMVNKK